MTELSVVLPCLNEAETLATCITKARGSMEALGVDGEIVVADNGSTDGSERIATSLGARVVPVPERGYGAAPALHRYLGNPVLSWVGRLFFKVPINDFHCGMRGFARDRILGLGLTTTGMEFASEMVVRAAIGGLTITEVPTTLKPDGRSREPHLRTWRDGWRHLRFLLAFSPRWLFLYPAVFLVVLGTVVFTRLAVGPVSIGSVTFD